jgi:hypothetical protein
MSQSQKNPSETTFSSENSLLVIFEGPGDNTRRPRRPNNPRDWPGSEPPQKPQPPADQPPPPPDGSGQ